MYLMLPKNCKRPRSRPLMFSLLQVPAYCTLKGNYADSKNSMGNSQPKNKQFLKNFAFINFAPFIHTLTRRSTNIVECKDMTG